MEFIEPPPPPPIHPDSTLVSYSTQIKGTMLYKAVNKGHLLLKLLYISILRDTCICPGEMQNVLILIANLVPEAGLIGKNTKCIQRERYEYMSPSRGWTRMCISS